MKQIKAETPEAGINFLRGVKCFADPPDGFRDLDSATATELGIEDFQLVSQGELPRDMTFGYSYNTWTVNTMVYCCFLLRKFTMAGGKIVKRELRSPVEVFSIANLPPTPTVVNASGIGFGDDKVFITRGAIFPLIFYLTPYSYFNTL
jgi:hypothetical protein